MSLLSCRDRSTVDLGLEWLRPAWAWRHEQSRHANKGGRTLQWCPRRPLWLLDYDCCCQRKL